MSGFLILDLAFSPFVGGGDQRSLTLVLDTPVVLAGAGDR
jgi:hypothetical protein